MGVELKKYSVKPEVSYTSARWLGHAGQRELRSRIQKRLGGRLGGLQQGGFERGGHQGFEVAAADFGVGVFRRDDFALLREANLPRTVPGGCARMAW